MFGSLQKGKRKVKRCIYEIKDEIQEQFGRKMNQDVNGNRKMFWKEVSKDKGERTECSNYRSNSLLIVVGKICSGILVDRVHNVTEGLIDYEQGGFRAGRGCIDQIFTLSQKGEKAQDKKPRVYVGFMDLEKAYDRVNKEVI